MFKTVLSLYDRTGAMSAPWRAAGYQVVQVDAALDGSDVRLFPYHSDLDVIGIIAMPPCNMFSYARGRKPTDAELLNALSNVDAVLRLVHLYQPDWWVMENPWHGSLIHYLGPPRQVIKLGDFGYPTIKKTNLWGDFAPVKRLKAIYSTPDIWVNDLGKSLRSETPVDLGISFFNSNSLVHA